YDRGDFADRFGSLSVVINEDNEIVSYDNTFIELGADDIETVATKAISSGEERGAIKSYDLLYKVKELDSGHIISFADYSTAHKNVTQNILFNILIFIVGMVIFLLASIWLSGYAMRPVKKAWDQQHQFIADASHELKTPLTAILANNNILLSHADSTVEEQKKWIENSQAEAKHMKELVNNMLFLAKSDGEEVKILFSEVSLTDLVTDSSLQFEPVAFERGIIMETDISEGISMQGDTTQLRQLIHILLDNACKYADENGRVDVRLYEHNNAIKLEVANTGKPIPPEDLPHIFERFYRSDKARTQQNQAGGYGLGLAIAHRIVTKHKGTINATSNSASGTKFTVTFKHKN
ncbi:MAG: HAMP domain-containing histidine kinase, partial [Firmicutes bacterium]|nr:HAMP domain-containing histidine kinase [Bacillota bacterium]